jgi:hypothetical protein
MTGDDRFFALWVLEATTGMRRSELAGVHRDGIDFDISTLTVGSNRVVIDGKVVEEDGKSDNSRRTIALDPYTPGVLRSHMNMLDAERAVAGEPYQDHGLLFCWEDGRPPHPDTITTRFNRLAQAAGLPRIRLHDVRHSYATAGRLARVDIKALSQRVGHTSVSFTMETYMHGDLEVDREVAQTLASVILAGLPDKLALVRRYERGQSVTKSVTTEHETGPAYAETGPVFPGSGGRIRTADLWVMSPASYRAAPPRVAVATVRAQSHGGQIDCSAVSHRHLLPGQ